ncbi:hypothetical protein ANANG_G00044160 [Anguilla anguilla]|uniref:Uncharacterized protein n=1 Tax=Anguilla anguilla TaxID=7936 RepID=A0A9D3MU48_ANGAN|nr:hypothetical protein ANANG_G00044160 [Anguilla anguilla]
MLLGNLQNRHILNVWGEGRCYFYSIPKAEDKLGKVSVVDTNLWTTTFTAECLYHNLDRHTYICSKNFINGSPEVTFPYHVDVRCMTETP